MTQVSLGKIIADFETSLAAKMSIGATTGTLLSATDSDGVGLPTGRYFFSIDGNNASKEFISCTLTGTALTAVKTLARQGTETSGTLREHRTGAKVTITDFAHIKKINDLLDGTTKFDGSVILGYSGTATLGADGDFATKKYVDDTAIAGAPDASDTTKGITKLSVAAVSGVIPIAVGDNDPRMSTTDEKAALAGTSGTPSSINKYVTNNDTNVSGISGTLARRDANGDVIVPFTPSVSGSAASKTYVDTNVVATRFISSSTNTTTAIPTGANWAFIQVSASSAHSGNVYNFFVSPDLTPTVMACATPTNSIESVSVVATWNPGGNLVATTSGTITSYKVAFYK